MAIEISRQVLARILAHAAGDPEWEVCGLLFGQPDRIDVAEPARNIAPSPADSFELDPAQLIAAHRAARAGGPAVIGHYHSHPGGRAVPSMRDADAARGGELWLIVADGEAAAFRAEADRTFRPVALRVR
ncbi:M67 family metallopeptidase [Sphingomonas sp. 1P06PA]|uniref:M67 family metallopeptidase n=1 Tax=Sphingomonas sp. 1P06PA TaxID=554121 RepID=UPI0039A75F18